MSGHRALNVLVVDDMNTNRQLMQTMLRTMGHKVMLAEDGVQALLLCEAQLPDVVLMDVAMPVMSGFETVLELRRRHTSWFPIVFLSAQTGNQEVVEGLHAGGDDYLFKPVNYEILQAKINMFQLRLEQNLSLLNYRARIEEETNTARDFIKEFIALDKIHDPLVNFFLKSADNFSGDVIAVARRPDNCLHVLLADSAGHGLTAALAVIPITQPFYQMTGKGFDLPAIVRELNRRVREYLPLPRFVAAAMLSLDPVTGVVQVWNGGCPSVLLLSAEGETLFHSFTSRYLPLGVLAPAEMDVVPEYYTLSGRSGKLLMCSDGATEISLEEGLELGQNGILSCARHSSAGSFFDRVVDVLKGHLGAAQPVDDIALIVVDCPGIEAPRPLISQPENNSLCGHGASETSVWKFSLMLTAHQLKRLDVVPLLLNIAGQLEGARSDGKLFLVLSELFNNALDHGVLKLDSAMKDRVDGMELYFAERSARLAELTQGRIFLRLDKLDCGCIKVSMKDSGEGFDYSSLLFSGAFAGLLRHSRGISLLSGMCSALQYAGNGSEVAAYIDVSGSGMV
jgi:DNA-binding response OmpR family regulator